MPFTRFAPFLAATESALSSENCSSCQKRRWETKHLVFNEAELDYEEGQQLQLENKKFTVSKETYIQVNPFGILFYFLFFSL